MTWGRGTLHFRDVEHRFSVSGLSVADVGVARVTASGEVFGLTVRSRNFFSDVGSGFKSLLGGELKGLTKALATSREEALTRMVDQAKSLGANGVVMMRFEVSDARDMGTEVCAYGTAVTVRKL